MGDGNEAGAAEISWMKRPGESPREPPWSNPHDHEDLLDSNLKGNKP
jgi:hypothetical protein